MSITLPPQVAEILPMLKALPTAEKLEIIHAITLSEDSKQMVDDTASEWAFLDKIHAIGEPDPSFEKAIQSLRETAKSQERDWSCFE